MKHRLEDIGYIRAKIEQLIDREIWIAGPGRPKDWDIWWETLSEERQHDFLHQLFYELRDINEALYDILSVTRGEEYDTDPSIERQKDFPRDMDL